MKKSMTKRKAIEILDEIARLVLDSDMYNIISSHNGLRLEDRCLGYLIVDLSINESSSDKGKIIKMKASARFQELNAGYMTIKRSVKHTVYKNEDTAIKNITNILKKRFNLVCRNFI